MSRRPHPAILAALLGCATLVVGALGPQAHARTIIDRDIVSDTTWGAVGSPYIVQKPVVMVRFGSTLTIEPGVEVRFEPGRILTTDPDCSIIAVGSVLDTIVFTSNSVAPSTSDWDKVEVWASSGSVFERCVFRYANTGLYLIASDPPVWRCAFRQCETGLHCWQSSPTIEHCSVSGSTSAGILCRGRESIPVIYDCNLIGNPWNVYLIDYSGSEPEVTITAEGNWWGSAEESAIRASIYDKDDNIGVNGVVDYDPWLGDQPIEERSWGRIKALFRR
jgi:hypothetical protein